MKFEVLERKTGDGWLEIVSVGTLAKMKLKKNIGGLEGQHMKTIYE